MNKYPTADNTLLELWAIKDETAARYKTVGEYFAHLGLKQAPQRPLRVSSRRAPAKPKALASARRVLPA